MNPQIGDKRITTEVYTRRDCDFCDKPATNKVTFLLENARNNPASSAYGGDDISWCSDGDPRFACDDHKDMARREPESGYEWCSTYGVGEDEKWLSRVCYWMKLS